jgi:hypothetical protein
VTRRQRLVNLGIAAAIAVVAVVVILATSGDSEEGERQAAAPTATSQPQATGGGQATSTPRPRPTEPPLPEITIKDGEPVGGVTEIRVEQGDRISFAVKSDVADHVHVHAYDIFKDVEPGKRVIFSFKATITGITEVELEDRGVEIASLRVDP